MSSTINSSAPMAGANTGQIEQEATPPVTVSMKKLTAGVTTMFAGIVQMLEALEPQMAQRLADIAIQGNTNSAETDVHPELPDGGKEGESVEAKTANIGVPDPAAFADGVPSDGTAESSEVKQKKTDPATATTSSSVTEDDITKIIVRKIKQDRSNNEKIGAILRTYGATKVSDLPVAKYEAFLTDVSQL